MRGKRFSTKHVTVLNGPDEGEEHYRNKICEGDEMENNGTRLYPNKPSW